MLCPPVLPCHDGEEDGAKPCDNLSNAVHGCLPGAVGMPLVTICHFGPGGWAPTGVIDRRERPHFKFGSPLYSHTRTATFDSEKGVGYGCVYPDHRSVYCASKELQEGIQRFSW